MPVFIFLRFLCRQNKQQFCSPENFPLLACYFSSGAGKGCLDCRFRPCSAEHNGRFPSRIRTICRNRHSKSALRSNLSAICLNPCCQLFRFVPDKIFCCRVVICTHFFSYVSVQKYNSRFFWAIWVKSGKKWKIELSGSIYIDHLNPRLNPTPFLPPLLNIACANPVNLSPQRF